MEEVRREAEGQRADEFNELSSKLEELEQERQILIDKIKQMEEEHRSLEEFLLKMKEEFTFAKKALEREQERKEKLLAERIVRDLFPIIDTLDHALEHDGNPGLVMLRTQLLEVLGRYGLTEVGGINEEFDPSIHEFVGYVPGPSGKVISVVRKGYKLGEVLLRPAMVMVGMGQETDTGENCD